MHPAIPCGVWPARTRVWNEACHSVVVGVDAPMRGQRSGGLPRELCLVKRQLPSSRQCQCAAPFAGGTDRTALTSVARSCTAPVDRETVPADQ